MGRWGDGEMGKISPIYVLRSQNSPAPNSLVHQESIKIKTKSNLITIPDSRFPIPDSRFPTFTDKF